jgi:hypothetical protein
MQTKASFAKLELQTRSAQLKRRPRSPTSAHALARFAEFSAKFGIMKTEMQREFAQRLLGYKKDSYKVYGGAKDYSPGDYEELIDC